MLDMNAPGMNVFTPRKISPDAGYHKKYYIARGILLNPKVKEKTKLKWINKLLIEGVSHDDIKRIIS